MRHAEMIHRLALAAAAFFAADAFVILHDKGNHTVWPVEIVMLTGFATGALMVGAVVGRSISSRTQG